MKILSSGSDCKLCTFKSFLFTRMTDEELGYINQFRKEMMFERGELILQEGDPVEDFMYLKKGLIKLVKKSDNKKERIISIARPLDFVSLLSTFSDKEYKFSIAALEKSFVCSIRLSAMREVISRNGGFALELLEQISRSHNLVFQSTYDIDDKNLRGRIAYILLWFSEKIYHSNVFDIPVSRREIGELINMTTENVIRILSEFRKDGILSMEGKTIEILNKEMLEKLNKSA
jgi:CRP-like cAMP-binding protein